MINASASSPVPQKSFSELVAELQQNDAPQVGAAPTSTQTTTQTTTTGNTPSAKRPRRFNPRVVLGSLVMMLLLVGGAVGVYMVQRQGVGETRQQASVTTGKPEGIAAYTNVNAAVS